MAHRAWPPLIAQAVITDTTFLSDLWHSVQAARRFLERHRTQQFLVTVISVGEIGVIFANEHQTRAFLAQYRILNLRPEIAYAAAAVDKELIQTGARLGENDNWIAGFCRYYRQPLISRDSAFDRVRGLRRLNY